MAQKKEKTAKELLEGHRVVKVEKRDDMLFLTLEGCPYPSVRISPTSYEGIAVDELGDRREAVTERRANNRRK
jgi:hypothetical protein